MTSGLAPCKVMAGSSDIEAIGQDRRGVGAGQAGIAEGEVARVNPGVSMTEPAGGLAEGDEGPQALDQGGGGSRRRRFQPGDGVLGFGQRRQQRMRVCVAGRHAVPCRREGGYGPSRTNGVGGCHH
jgi:hypothetical protein